ncbi:DUF3426 domain-containing protein [Noviherbaspirillum galbum]|uniref:DUF3426 domain-containing protein n=1 Tax=Noviherbaspirillum galbum TaxID=2709383 RepID=A0A6B3STW4_9BURK|nr:DUF3426 domain-containing protein [Noviherbaspirillum galbum]NEX64440.1 DUF3426 domain-containing protein [Noviherbaspirillum galbum]
MALATQCPHCQTTFRVAHDQLKLRAGLVRCGACKQIFNGIENLLRPEQVEQVLPSAVPIAVSSTDAAWTGGTQFPDTRSHAPAESALAEPPPPVRPANDPLLRMTLLDVAQRGSAQAIDAARQAPAHTEDMALAEESAHPPAEAGDASSATPESTYADAPADEQAVENAALVDGPSAPERTQEPAQEREHEPEMPALAGEPDVPSQVQPAPEAPRDVPPASDEATPDSNASGDDQLEQTIDDLRAKPWRNPEAQVDAADHDALDEADIREYEEPAFVRQGRRRQRLGKAGRILMLVLTPLLLLALLLQAAYVFRAQIAARWPQARPLLAAACQPLGCRVGLPAQIDQVALESPELQTAADENGALSLTALLRNQSALPQTWPHIELTLNDANEKPIARRVFTPSDYLPAGADAGKGFPARSEQVVKMRLALAGLKASGYRVYVFYP